MSKQTVSKVASLYCDALVKAAVRYRLVKSRMSSSRYIHIYNRLGIRQYVVRISQHPRNPDQEDVEMEIGDYEGARYPLKSWYLALTDIAAVIKVAEVTRIFSRIVAEEKLKRKPVSLQFRTVMRNIEKKAQRGRSQPTPDLTASNCLAVLEDFAARYQFRKHIHNVGSCKFIGLQNGKKSRIVWVALAAFDQFMLPPGAGMGDILSFGQYRRARYRPHQWHTLIEDIAFQFGFKSRGSRKTLNRFIREKKALYAPMPETKVFFKP